MSERGQIRDLWPEDQYNPDDFDDEDEDADDPDPFDDDYYDDLMGPHREEPNCGACNDHGCKECSPSRARLTWWRICHRARALRPRFRRRPSVDFDEPPF